LDILKLLEKESKGNIEKNLDSFKDVSIAITAMVNAYAKFIMHKHKLEILKNGGSIYYTDTDSIVLDKSSFNKELISSEIGKFKLEYEIKEAYFISNKTYCLVLHNKDIIIKIKGVKNNSLSLEDFKSMYRKKKNTIANKTNTTYNYVKAFCNDRK
jgi:hypothetical protein